MNGGEKNKCKIIVVGESGVGKTSIISVFQGTGFDDCSSSTIGANFITKKLIIEETCLDLVIWDTAGQEKYRNLTKIFFRDTTIALIVYDICSSSTFNEAVEFWVYEVKKYSKDIICALVGNKSDLIEKEAVNEETAKTFAEKENILFGVTSAKDNTGINEIFEAVCRKYLEKFQDLSRTQSESFALTIKREDSNLKEDKKKVGCC